MKLKHKKHGECCDWQRIQDRILDDIFDAAADIHGWSISDFSRKTGLAWNTIENIRARITKRPQFRTVILLARAVHFNVTIVERELKKAKAA